MKGELHEVQLPLIGYREERDSFYVDYHKSGLGGVTIGLYCCNDPNCRRKVPESGHKIIIENDSKGIKGAYAFEALEGRRSKTKKQRTSDEY